MGIFNSLANEVKAAIGYQQTFTELLEAKDVSRAISMMKDCSIQAANNLRDFEISTHKIMERKDRAVFDKKDMDTVLLMFHLLEMAPAVRGH